MADYDYRKLRGRIIEQFGTYGAFYEKLDITDIQASKKLGGKAGFSQDDMVRWSGLLGADISEIGPLFCTLKV